MALNNWLESYVRSRSSAFKKEFKHSEGYYYSGTTKYVISDPLNVVDGDILVCLNVPENVSVLVNNWNIFVEKNCKVLFVNPTSNSKWMINPVIHNKVADPETLESGINSLAQSCGFI